MRDSFNRISIHLHVYLIYNMKLEYLDSGIAMIFLGKTYQWPKCKGKLKIQLWHVIKILTRLTGINMNLSFTSTCKLFQKIVHIF